MRVAVIGVGLIGGSIGLAARARLDDARVCGFDPAPDALEDALQRHALDEAAGSVAEAVAGAQLCFVAAPVGALPSVVAETLDAAPSGCAVSDVGSTKRAVMAGIVDQRFVGGHPLTGAETAGVRHARADLFEGATWYLTPGTGTSGVLYERLHRALTAFGARPTAIDPGTHDTLLAAVSHLPHVLANILVGQAARTLTAPGAPAGLPATGPSFRDATRVAGANTAIWTDIYLANVDALVARIDDTIARLGAVRERLDTRDAGAVAAWNDAAAADRRALLEGQLATGPLCELRVPVPNRPGVVAQIALALGRAGLDIADLALAPAPDQRQGVISLWVAGEGAAARARELIEGLGYPAAAVGG